VRTPDPINIIMFLSLYSCNKHVCLVIVHLSSLFWQKQIEEITKCTLSQYYTGHLVCNSSEQQIHTTSPESDIYIVSCFCSNTSNILYLQSMFRKLGTVQY
jgi:hypothetical protein